MLFVFDTFLFEFGPVSYNLKEPVLFWCFLFLYQFALLLGYCVGVFSFKRDGNLLNNNYLPIRFFYIVVVFSVFANLIFYKNVMMYDGLIPYNLIDDLMLGVNNPNQSYVDRMVAYRDQQSNKLFNFMYFFISFSKPLLTVMIVFYWNKISVVMRVVVFIIILFQIVVGVSAGINKPIFDFFVYFSFALVVMIACGYFRGGREGLGNNKFFVFISIASFFVFFYMFGYFMSSRGGDVVNISRVSSLGDITVPSDVDLNSFFGFIYYAFIWLSSYITQGYYGFSLALTQNFDSTFGFGSSEFLLRQWEWISGNDISNRTYQSKITDLWDEHAQWHSFYSHIANDVHFIGVVFVMLGLGFYFSRIWLISVEYNNIYAKLLIPLIVVMVIFIPANNQVFGYLETLSYFIVLNVSLIFSQFFCKKQLSDRMS